ncbi:cytochrome ubiquinol oxidase subunit I [Phytoactinopolyspora halotolerans]|uniref:Cytochrome ubiquinol oxidase subunit I n=2 Tax=Phytoactinopolyspora halotolerans TaxID=1981512 RepID=A0A6L9SAN5_9ACTN|nr:cytochrome ubiquinol oxidase subunit I [Phytoactinopolyspora halotolerans]
MQALSLAVHIPLVCFGIAFPAMVLYMEGLHLRTGDPLYRAIAKRWSKVMLILFAVGVVTGTILSFELGLLWPRFMERFAEVFGMAFALEGVSFFVEAIFIAIYVYGWDRLPARAHLLAGVPIVVAGMTGSLMVIGVNGWMNDPGGFELDAAGNVTDVNPFAAFVNSNVWHETVHMYLAGIMVAGFIVAGVYAFGWLRGKRDRFHRAAMVVPLTFACLAAPVQIVVGDWAARTVAEVQPTKLAAIEGLEETTAGADLTIGGILTIPDGLSLLAQHDPDAVITGLDAVPVDERPPVAVVQTAFQTMVGIGTALAVLAAVYLATMVWRRRLPRSAWFYRAVVAAGPLALVALIAGWIVTEVGRQPWIVYRVMRVEEAVTGAGGIPVGYVTLALVYAGLAAIVLFLLRRLARRPLEVETPEEHR